MSTQTYVHSMSSVLDHTDKCRNCGFAGALVREPALFTTKSDLSKLKGKPGDVVKEFIEEAKESVSREKESLKRGEDVQ